MRRLLSVTAVVLLVSLAGASARAGSVTFDFTFSGPFASGHGTLEATPNGDGSYTAVSGIIYSSVAADNDLPLIPNPIAPAAANDPSGAIYDDQLFPSQPTMLLDDDGILLGTGNGYSVNMYGIGSSGYVYADSANQGGSPSSFTLTAVPEPSSLAMCVIAGLIGSAYAWRRRERAA